MMKGSTRRYKIECLLCGAIFNNDYKQSHFNKKHGGQAVRVKIVGAPENPFVAAAPKRKRDFCDNNGSSCDEPITLRLPTGTSEEANPILDPPAMETDTNTDFFTVTSTSKARESEHVISDVIEEADPVENESNTDNTVQELDASILDLGSNSFEQCVGTFASLIDKITSCKEILNEVNENTIVDRHSIVLKIIDSVEFVKKSCEDTLNICTQYDKSIERRENSINFAEGQNQMCEMVNHDPGIRKKLHSDNERNYLITLGPHQPILGRFPSDGKNRFNPKWYREYNFIEYSTVKDAAFCFVCFIFPSGAGKEKSETAWSSEGVKGWGKMKSKGKDEKGKLDKHFSSTSHKCAMSDYVHFLKKEGHVDNILDQDMRNILIEEERIQNYNKKTIEILLDIAKTLSRQGLAFRGTEDDHNGNFRQIVQLVARHNPILKHWIKNEKFRSYHVSYLGKESQNEFIKLIGNEICREMVKEISTCKFITVMADTTADSSNKDILSVVVRSVGDDGCPRERLVDVVVATDKTGLGIAKTIIQSLNDMNIDVGKIAFQSYDFAASMSGQFNGTQKHISDLVGHNVPYIACQAHRTNTAVEHSCNVSKIIGDLFLTLEELYVFFSSSTKRFQLFKDKISEIENALQLKNLSKTRWTARAESIDAVDKSLEVIIELLLEMSNSNQCDARTKTKAYGLYKKVLTFDFIISLKFMKPVLFKTKVLTKLLENIDLNVVDVITCIKSTITSLGLIRNSEIELNNLIESAKIFAVKLNIDPDNDFKKHHLRRVAPKRLDENRDTQVVHNLISFYRQEFILILDTLSGLLSSNVQSCIDSLKPCFQIFQFPLGRNNLKTENIVSLLRMFPNQDDLPNMEALQAELEILFDNCTNLKKMAEVVDKIREMNFLKLASEAVNVVMTAGYSVATNERKFSLLKWIKNDIRSRMGDERLRDLLITKSEEDITDNLNLEGAVKLWSKLKNRRIRLSN